MTEELVLSLRHVTAGYREGGVLGRKRFHEVLHDVSFDVHRGEICGLVGESGTGKSTLARTILQMVKPEQGEVIHYTKRPQMIFQDPYSSLNPAYPVEWLLEEPLRIYGKYDAQERRRGCGRCCGAWSCRRRFYPPALGTLRRPAAAGTHRYGADSAAPVPYCR